MVLLVYKFPFKTRWRGGKVKIRKERILWKNSKDARRFLQKKGRLGGMRGKKMSEKDREGEGGGHFSSYG